MENIESLQIPEGFLYGMFGGFLAELLGLFKLRRQTLASLPEWLKSPFYWLVTGMMIFAGGVLVAVYLKSKIPLNPLLAVNVGASAPLIIGSFVEQTPPISPGRTD